MAYGIYQPLRLDYCGPKQRAQQSAAIARLRAGVATAPGATFLESPAAMLVGGCQYRLALEDADGARMRGHVQDAQPLDLVALSLSRTFWNPST